MNRRDFMTTGLAAGAALTTATAAAQESPPAGKPFKLKYAPHFGMFKHHAGDDLVAQLKFMAAEGFTAFEDNGMLGRSPADQELVGKTLADLGMTMGVFVIDAGDNWKTSLASGQKEFHDRFVDVCKRSVEVARRVKAKWMTVVPGFFERKLPIGLQTGHVIDALRAGAEVFAPEGLCMVLEPLSDTPDLFLRTSDQTYEICRAVNSPACKILFDMYHMQKNEGNVLRNIDLTWSEIGYFQVGDAPGRKEPGTGESNYKNLFKHIHDRAKAEGREFILGMEHGNSRPGREGERAVIDAYRACDDF